MKFVYKGCTYRTENLTDDQKKVMEKEIKAAEKRQQVLNIVKEVAEDKKTKVQKSQKAK